MTAITISQFNGNEKRANTRGVIHGSTSTQTGLMQHVTKNETANPSSATRHRVARPTSPKATSITAAIAAFARASRPRNFAFPRHSPSVYLPGAGSGMSVSPGTFSAVGENRPPKAMPPGSGWYNSMAICEIGSEVTPLTGLSAMVSEATARMG